MSDLYGPSGKPIIDQQIYPLGGGSLPIPGKPEELLKSAIGVNASGQMVMNPPVLAFATWAYASMANLEQAGRIQDLEARMTAMERVLKEHQPKVHDFYVLELAQVKREQVDAAIKKAAAAGIHVKH